MSELQSASIIAADEENSEPGLEDEVARLGCLAEGGFLSPVRLAAMLLPLASQAAAERSVRPAVLAGLRALAAPGQIGQEPADAIADLLAAISERTAVYQGLGVSDSCAVLGQAGAERAADLALAAAASAILSAQGAVFVAQAGAEAWNAITPATMGAAA
jgi:hypothetical protein